VNKSRVETTFLLFLLFMILTILVYGCASLRAVPQPTHVRYNASDLPIGNFELVRIKTTPKWMFWDHPQSILWENITGVPQPIPLSPSEASFLSGVVSPITGEIKSVVQPTMPITGK